jgi:hypothetical protein
VTHSDTIVPGNCAGSYTIKRSWKATDGCGNQSTCMQTITVTDTTVQVALSLQKTAYFGGWLGQKSIAIGASATATYEAEPMPCMLALGPDEPVGIEMIGAAKVSGPKCVVESNSTRTSIAMQGAPKMIARKVCAAGNATKARSNPPPEKCKPGDDPYDHRDLHGGSGSGDRGGGGSGGSGSNNSGSKPTKTTGTSSYSAPCDYINKSFDKSNSKSTVLLKPGVYCGGLSIQSVDVQLAPGLYIMQDGPLSLQGNATLTGSGVSILLSGMNAVLDLQGSPSITLTAMSSGPMAGIAIASDTPASPILTSSLQGSPDINVTGSIYLPNQRLDMQGNPSLNLLGLTDRLIALSFRLQGSPDITLKTDSSLLPGGTSAMVRLMQ